MTGIYIVCLPLSSSSALLTVKVDYDILLDSISLRSNIVAAEAVAGKLIVPYHVFNFFKSYIRELI